MVTRRDFLNTMAAGAATLTLTSTAKSYGQILGSNDRLNFAVIGVRSRAYAHLSALKSNKSAARITHVCDVDANTLKKFTADTEKEMGEAPKPVRDFREILATREVDAITIAAPDHWHTPMAVLGLKAGKNVYVEKPCSHNPGEGVLLVKAQQKYGKVAQMGNQQRSSKHTIEIVDKVRNGIIGNAYYAKTFYCNNRTSIGIGKPAPVPAELDWDLWQGPAPRRDYHDNYQPYTWHWFKHWGTGETLNNGTHEVDIARWVLGVDFPESISATGGRYAFRDDWEFYDTLVTSFRYPGKQIVWEGFCCQPFRQYGRDRGVVIQGTTGSIVLDRDGYDVFDFKGKKTDEYRTSQEKTASTDLVGRDSMTDAHFANFIAAIKTGEKLHAPVAEGNVAVTMLQLSNVAWELNRVLELDTADGKVKHDPEAMKRWDRTYEKGWEPTI